MAKSIETRVVLSGKLSPSMVKSLSNMQNHLDKTKKKADSLGNVADGLGRKLAGAAGIFSAVWAGASVGRNALDAAASMEAYRGTLNVVMKDSEKAAEAMKWAVDFANRTPFETDSVVQATVMLESYGLKAQSILPRIGNMAGVMNKDIIQAVEAVADAQTGELERLKEFSITKGQIIEKAGRMFQGIEVVNNKGQIVNQEKFNEALFALMDDRFKGGMEIQAKGWKGIWSTVTGVYKSSLAKIMGMTDAGDIKKGSVFDILKIEAQDFADYLQRLYNSGELDRIGEGLASGLETTFKVLGAIERAGPVLIPMLAGMTAGTLAYTAATKGAMIITALSKAWEYSTTVMSLMRAGTSLAAIAQMELNLAMSANPIGLVVLAIGAAIAAGVALYQNWDIIIAKAKALGDAVKKFIEPVMNVLNGKTEVTVFSSNKKIPQGNNVSGQGTPYPKFAKGGFSDRPGIFGDAGLEAAIPIKKRNPRSLALLNQTARMLGVPTGQGVQITYAPVIQGGDPAAIRQVLAQDKQDFRRIIDEYFLERERVSYGI